MNPWHKKIKECAKSYQLEKKKKALVKSMYEPVKKKQKKSKLKFKK